MVGRLKPIGQVIGSLFVAEWTRKAEFRRRAVRMMRRPRSGHQRSAATNPRRPRKERSLPIVRIEMLPGRSLAQKRELARVITDAVCNIAHTRPEDTIVLFSEYSVEAWATKGKLYVDQDDEEDED
jgi:4-oxalocrotonate tautomerase